MLIVLIVLVKKKPIKAPNITVCDAWWLCKMMHVSKQGARRCTKIVLAACGSMRLKTSGSTAISRV